MRRSKSSQNVNSIIENAMGGTREVNEMSDAIDQAFASVIISPNLSEFQKLEPYKEHIDAVIDIVLKKHGIAAFHRNPITQFEMSETVFKLTKIAQYMTQKFGKNPYTRQGGNLFLTFVDDKFDIIYEQYRVFQSGKLESTIYFWYSLQNRITPSEITKDTKNTPFPKEHRLFVPDIETRKERPYAVMMVYENSYIEIGELDERKDYMDQFKISIKEIRPLRAKEAMNMILNFHLLETKSMRIVPNPEAFKNIIYFQEAPVFRMIWKPFTRTTDVYMHGKKFNHLVHPDVVFDFTSNRLNVFILQNNDLYEAPYYNTNKAGNVCMGIKIDIKAGMLSDTMKHLEELFFFTDFNHSQNEHYSNQNCIDFLVGKYDNIKFRKSQSLSQYLKIDEDFSLISQTENEDD